MKLWSKRFKKAYGLDSTKAEGTHRVGNKEPIISTNCSANISTHNQLQRKLNTRIINMIALGGSIGTGIFLASGNAIYLSGPGGTMLAYFITGLMAYFLMTSLCEMAAFMPETGSFAAYSGRFVDPALGYAMGWNYWFSWAITVASEISAASLVMQYWFPHSSPFIWCAIFLTTVVGFNAFSTRAFGEAEYWFSLIKIIVIVVFITAGTALALGFTQHESVGFKNWTQGDAPFHGSWLAIFSAFMVAGFSFQGTELIGITAGETHNPKQDIPKAVKQVFWRILLFFILSIFVISLLIPHTAKELADTNVATSPFTLVFKQYGINLAAGFINMVILVAILSTGNSGMYAATRMLWHLSRKGYCPALFTHLNKNGVPIFALIMTTCIAMLAFLSSFYGSGTVYLWLINASSLAGFIAWMGIAVSHYRFRKAYLLQGKSLADLPYLAKGYPYGPLCVFALCFVIVAGQNYQALLNHHIDWTGMFISYGGVPAFLCLWLGYKVKKRTKLVLLHDCKFEE